MATPLALVWDLIARDGATPVFNRVAASATRAAGATEKASVATAGFGKKMAAAFAALGVLDIGVHAIKAASDFQRSMLLIQTQAGASAAEVKKMTAAVLEIAPSVGTGPQELATALYHIESVGLRGAKALGVLKIAAEGAKIGNANLEETTNALTSTVASGIPGVHNMKEAMGALNAVVGAGDMKLSDLNEAFGTGILTRMKQYGLTLTDVGAALATFGDNNIRGADAATLLRMGVEALVKQGKPGQQALAGIGIKVNQLRDDIQKGGLNRALLDLNSHLKRAGITGNQVGSFLLDAFSKKGGGGVSVLIGQLDRYEQKTGQVTAGIHGFDDAWAATRKSTSFLFDQLKTQIETTGISIGTKLLPMVAAAAAWLGTNIPAAVHTLADILGPTVHLVGDALGGAFHSLGVILGVVGGALAGIGGVLSAHKELVTGVATAVLTMWAAYKGYLIARIALAAIPAMFNRIGAAAEGAAAKVAVGLGPVGIAIAALGVMIGGAAMASDNHAAALSREKDEVSALTDAINADSGALGAHARAVVEDALVQSGAFTAARALHISLGLVTDAAMGNTAALKEVNKQAGLGMWQQRIGLRLTDQELNSLDGKTKAQYTLNEALNGSNSAVKTATQRLKDKAAADKGSTAEAKKAAVAALNEARAFKITNPALQQYGVMMGLVIDKTGKVAGPAMAARRSLDTIRHAANTATETMSAFIAAWQTFSTSTGTAADRAAIIGATLKAANGDALNFAAGMNASAVASKTFFGGIRDAAKTAKESTRQYLGSLINLKNGTINYSKAAAAPLIANLSGIQSAAMNAAQAEFQHARATMSGKDAADAAYKVYVTKTRGLFIDSDGRLTAQAKKIGLNKTEAKKLSDQYFGMPKKVKTLIEQEGANPIVEVLNKIGKLLATITGQKWVSTLGADTKPAHDKITAFGTDWRLKIANMSAEQITLADPDTSGARATVNSFSSWFNQQIADMSNQRVTVPSITPGAPHGGIITGGGNKSGGGRDGSRGNATGGTIFGPGTGTSDSVPLWGSVGEEVINARQAGKHRRLLKMINAGVGGFASGGTVGGGQISTGILGGKKIWIYNGKDYGSLLGATNAYNRDHAGNANSYTVGGKHYSTLSAAENHGQSLMAAKIKLDVKIDTKDLPKFAKAVKGTVDQARAAFATLFADARTAGVSSTLLKHLRAEDKHLNHEIDLRNKFADKLKAVKEKMAELASSIKSGITGAFDVTSSGANAVTGQVSGAGMLAQQSQALTQIRKFSTDIRKLENRHLNHPYLMQLASQGPSVVPQLEALLSMPAKSFAQFNRQEAAIARAGARLGANVAQTVYGSQVDQLTSDEHKADMVARKIAHHMAAEIRHAVDVETSRPIIIKYHGKTFLEITREEQKKAKR